MRLAIDDINNDCGLRRIIAAPANADALDSPLRHQRGSMAFFDYGGAFHILRAEYGRLREARVRAQYNLGAYSVNSCWDGAARCARELIRSAPSPGLSSLAPISTEVTAESCINSAERLC